ncbi:MAG: cation diffusion facilitator family transporter [Saprospiraceae bacterium]|nr:cation transporter [Candidatus Vicinibacter proximus]
MNSSKINSYQTQKLLLAVSFALLVIKLTAYYLTGSVAVLTDALESIVNVIAAMIGLYSLSLSALPKDANHPYGHGKVEFLSAGIEGSLIILAGLWIIYECVHRIFHFTPLQHLDNGMILLGISAVINLAVGQYSVKNGKKNNSLALISSGTHLKTDALTTFGLILGLAMVWVTEWQFLDSLVAIVFALVIIYSGFRIVRSALSGIMDEADEQLINQILQVLKDHRTENWLDIHNLRVVNYAGFFHIDGHITVPRYFTVDEAHTELDRITAVLAAHFEERVEFSIHTDGCIPVQCSLCNKQSCQVRSEPFIRTLDWNYELVIQNKKHRLPLE